MNRFRTLLLNVSWPWQAQSPGNCETIQLIYYRLVECLIRNTIYYILIMKLEMVDYLELFSRYILRGDYDLIFKDSELPTSLEGRL